MSIPAFCTNCGFSWQSNFIDVQGGATFRLKSVGISCPFCGAVARLEDGLYNAVGKVVEAAFAPGVSRDSIIAFQVIAEAAKAGSISAQEAELRAEEINPSFGILWRWLNENGSALGVVLTVLALLLGLYTTISTNKSADQQHTDFLNQIQAIGTQTEIQQKIYALVQKPLEGDQALAEASSTRSRPQALHQAQMQGPEKASHNRHERRKAARLTKVHPRKKP